MSKAELLTLLVAWSRMNDAALADDDACLSIEVCDPKDRPEVRRAALLIDHLRNRFSYLDSPRFHREIDGKSASYVSMRERLENAPTKRAAHLDMFTSALGSVLLSRDVYDLVPEERHAELDALANIFRQVANPDDGQRAL